MPCLLEAVQGCEWCEPLAASHHAQAQCLEQLFSSLPALRRPHTFCFIIKRICIGYTLKFSSHQQTVLSADIAFAWSHIITSLQEEKRGFPLVSWFSFPRFALLVFFFSFLLYINCFHHFATDWVQNSTFLKLEYRKFSVNIIVLSLLTKPDSFFFFFGRQFLPARSLS